MSFGVDEKPNDVRWKLTYKGNEYIFDAGQQLTVGRLRQMKKWFGQSYGQWATVIALLAQGDADAWASAIWISLKDSGEPAPSNPEMIDFAVGDLILNHLESIDRDDQPGDTEGSVPPTPSESTSDSPQT